MSKSYKIDVNSKYEFDISSEELTDLDVIDLSSIKKHVIKNQISYNAHFTETDFQNKSYQIMVNNNVYKVKINDGLDVLIKNLGFEIGSGKIVDKINAPMPGLILEISVNIGDIVEENQTLLILEAMKMENSITSPRSGTIKSIQVKKGDPVEKNQLLVEFE